MISLPKPARHGSIPAEHPGPRGVSKGAGEGRGAVSHRNTEGSIALLKGGSLRPDGGESLGGTMLVQLRGLIDRTRATLRGRRALVLLALMTALGMAGPRGVTAPIAATAANHHH